jgi:hypothetical protein
MNHPIPLQPWRRLTTAARTVIDDRDSAAPYGFATRLAALALAQERKVVSLFERFAFRALGAAFLLALVSVVVDYSVFSAVPTSSEDELIEDDPVAVLLDT